MTTLAADNRPKRRLYIGNLFRFRSMYQAMFIGILLAFALCWAGSVGIAIGFFGGYALMMWYWIHTQMVCENCRARLRAVRTQGKQTICQKCGVETHYAVDFREQMR